MDTLFDRIGGKKAVDSAVDNFYSRVLVDERIKQFFEGVDMTKQLVHQKNFLTYAFGGARSYPGKTLREAHQGLVKQKGLSDEHFDAVKEDLALTLSDMGVKTELITEVAEIVESVRNDVLDR